MLNVVVLNVVVLNFVVLNVVVLNVVVFQFVLFPFLIKANLRFSLLQRMLAYMISIGPCIGFGTI